MAGDERYRRIRLVEQCRASTRAAIMACLIAATKPPVGRMLMVSKFEETLVVGGERFDLSANEYPGVDPSSWV